MQFNQRDLIEKTAMSQLRFSGAKFAGKLKMLCHGFMQQWCNLSGPAVEEASHGGLLVYRFATLSLIRGGLSEETRILSFRYLLERQDMAAYPLRAVNLLLLDRGIAVRSDTIISAIRAEPYFYEERDPHGGFRNAST